MNIPSTYIAKPKTHLSVYNVAMPVIIKYYSFQKWIGGCGYALLTKMFLPVQ